jgi:Transglutaminase-like superfamily
MTGRMVRAAEHYSPGHATCLEESLTLWYLLEKQNISAVLRIGVRKQLNQFEAHAWVEQNGIALNQRDEQHRHYTPFENEQFNPPAAQS